MSLNLFTMDIKDTWVTLKISKSFIFPTFFILIYMIIFLQYILFYHIFFLLNWYYNLKIFLLMGCAGEKTKPKEETQPHDVKKEQ